MGFFSGVFDDFVNAVVTVTMSPGNVTTGIASSPVYDENGVPNYINKTLMASLVSGKSFSQELLERAVNSTYPGFKTKVEDTHLIGYTSSFTAEFPNFAEQNLPTGLKNFPHGPSKQGIYFKMRESWPAPHHRSQLQIQSWIQHYLYSQYRYDWYMNNVYDKTYQKGVWVGVKKIDVHVPGTAADYRPDFFDLTRIARYAVATGDTYTTQDTLMEVHYHEATVETGSGQYQPPAMGEPVVLNAGYVAPDIGDPVVLSASGGTTTEPFEPYVDITYEWRPGGHRSSNPLETEVETLPIPSWVLTSEATYWQVSPMLNIFWSGETRTNLIGPNDNDTYANKTIYFHWLYEDGSGVYPAWDAYLGNLDGSVSGEVDPQYVKPIAAAVYYDTDSNGYKLVDPVTTPSQYAGWEANAKVYGMDPVAVLDKLDGTMDLTNVHRVAFELGVSLATDDPILIKYLYKLFSRWYDQSINVPLSQFDNPDLVNYFTFWDMYVDRRYMFSGISKSTHTGTFSTEAKPGQYLKVAGTYTETFTDDTRGDSFSGTWDGIKIYRQITETSYEILRLGHPLCIYFSARGDTYGVAPDDERFIVPVHLTLARDMGGLNFDYLMYKAVRLTQVQAVVEDIGWMQTQFFQDVMKFIQLGMQITFAINGIQGIMAQFGLNAFVAAVVYAVLAVGVQATIEFVVQELGIENSIFLASALLVIGTVAGMNGTVFMDGLIDPMMLIQTANGLITAVNEERMEEVKAGYQQLQYEEEEFGRYYEDRIKELDEAKQLLGPQNVVNPYLFIGKVPMTIWGESPQSFYERTIHSGNIGTKAFDFVHNYVEQQVRLPSIEDTVGDRLYVA